MSESSKARLKVSILIFSMVNAVVFGLGLLTVLSSPLLAARAFVWVPVVVVASFVLSPPIAWIIAPSMMQRYLKAPNPPLAARLSREIEARST